MQRYRNLTVEEEKLRLLSTDSKRLIRAAADRKAMSPEAVDYPSRRALLKQQAEEWVRRNKLGNSKLADVQPGIAGEPGRGRVLGAGVGHQVVGAEVRPESDRDQLGEVEAGPVQEGSQSPTTISRVHKSIRRQESVPSPAQRPADPVEAKAS